MDWAHLLLPLSPLYGALVRARAAAYRRGLLPTTQLDVPVVSVGNLAFGGTGKTPTVISLVRDLVRRGRHPAVLTRGYGRRGSSPMVLLGPDVEVNVAVAGDEPMEMARRLPGVPIVVDADRVRGGREAMGLGADVLVLDDGFQHLRLARELDVVLLDAADPFAGGCLPPRGRLREPLTAMARASAVILSKLPSEESTIPPTVSEKVAQLAPHAPLLATALVPSVLRTPEGVLDLARLSGRRVLAFAALARPEAFAQLLGRLGAEVVAKQWYPDHHAHTAAEVGELAARAAVADAVAITTAKDATKIDPQALVWVLEVDVVPVDGGWDRLWDLSRFEAR